MNDIGELLEYRKVIALEQIAVCLQKLTDAKFKSSFDDSWSIDDALKKIESGELKLGESIDDDFKKRQYRTD